MPSRISFNDGAAAELANGRPAPFDRFSSWTPDVDSIGSTEAALGTGITFHLGYRVDYLASLELRHLRPAVQAIALRLKRHLETGGSATIETDDSGANTYTVRIAPGTRVQLEFSDSTRVLATLKLTVKNVAAAPMVCLY